MDKASNFTEQSIANYGVSEHLKAEFDMLRDVIGNNGQVKFTRKTVDSLAQHLVCRHYGNLCYEFAHINWAIIFTHTNYCRGNDHKQAIGTPTISKPSSIQQVLLDFYWISQCNSPRAFNAYFTQINHDKRANADSAFSVVAIINASATKIPGRDDNTLSRLSDAPVNTSSTPLLAGITLNIHGHSFSISANRANLLACFMEWLVCVVPNLLSLIETALLGNGHNAIREFSSVLQKHIYNYLGQHLPPAKLQLRYRLLQSWFQEYADLAVSDINDDSVLKFWQQHNSQEGYGKFSNVVKDSLSYQQALEITRIGLSVQYAHTSDDNNEVSPELLWPDSDEQGRAVFSQLAQYDASHIIDAKGLLSSPKVLNKQQFELIELAVLYPQYIVPLSMTWLRVQVFGKTQHQVIQLMRMKRLQMNCADDYSSLHQHNYEKVRLDCVSLMANNQQVLLAIVDILITETPKQACLILLKLMSSLPKYDTFVGTFTGMLDNPTVHGDDAESRINTTILSQWQLTNPWLKDILGQCRLACKHINREGFTAKTMLTSQQYVSAAEGLFDLNKLLKQLVTNINKKEQYSSVNFGSDRLIFNHEFSTLYSQDDK
jgi:hypothetical protein